MLAGALLDLAVALPGTVLVVALAWRLRGRPRFLARYALHAFYPGHLLVLAALRALMRAG